MRCTDCGREMEPQEQECAHCGRARGEVQVLSRQDRDSFQGVTLENEPAEQRSYEYESRGPNHRVYVRQVTFGPGRMGFWTKLLLGAIFLILIFVFLPLALFFITAVSLIWLLFRLIRG